MTLSKTLLIASLLAACEHDSNVGTEVDASTDGGSVAMCSPGSDRLVIGGAFSIDTQQIANVTVSGKVVGVGGQHAGNTVAFSVRNTLTDDVGTLGAHDVSTTNMKQLEVPPGGDCSQAGACTGFFALSGTFTVLEVQPRYRATFTLGDLFERHDDSNTPGPALAGTVAGCIDVAAP